MRIEQMIIGEVYRIEWAQYSRTIFVFNGENLNMEKGEERTLPTIGIDSSNLYKEDGEFGLSDTVKISLATPEEIKQLVALSKGRYSYNKKIIYETW